MTRLRSPLRAALFALPLMPALLGGCPPAAAPAPKMVSLRFTGTPENASVFVDDILLGPLDVVTARGVAVPAGVHHVTVQAEGYFPDDRVVEAPPTAGPPTPIVLTFALKKLPE